MNYILITGVSAGIGHGILTHLLNHDYTVFGTVRTDKDANRLQHELKNENFIPLIMDVTDEKSIQRAFKTTQKKLGKNRLSALINNAGTLAGGPFIHLPVNKYREVFDVNFFGALTMMKVFIPLLSVDSALPSKIINISSVLGHYGLPYLSTYVASKYAIEGFSDCVRQELEKMNIKLILLIPGAVKTQIFDKGIREDHSYVENTIFDKSGKKLKHEMRKLENKGMAPHKVSNKVLTILKSKRPRSRYRITGSPFTEWYLPKYLPDRTLDYILRKIIG